MKICSYFKLDKKTIIITKENENVLGLCITTIKPVEVDNQNGIECPTNCDKTIGINHAYKIESELISKGYIFKGEFVISPWSANQFAIKEREKWNLARVLKLRGITLTVYVKEKL